MPKIGGHTRYVGHSFKLCPYSTAYYNAYYVNGYDGNSSAGDPGNTTADHPYTEGTMVTWVSGRAPGFMCLDDNCPYYVANGKRYFEV